jgi:hypothetical protein
MSGSNSLVTNFVTKPTVILKAPCHHTYVLSWNITVQFLIILLHLTENIIFFNAKYSEISSSYLIMNLLNYQTML